VINSFDRPAVGILGLGLYAPPEVVPAERLAIETGIPAAVLRDKFGIRQVHRAGPSCHVSDMAVAAGRQALEDADCAAGDVDLVVYCGSEYKDYIVWSAAASIAHRLGCDRAEAYEIYALCAGTPLTLRVVKDMMLAEPEIQTALVVAASKESELVDRSNARTRFMFNFGDGAGAAVLRRGLDRNRVLGSASIVDGSLSLETIMPAGGSRRRASQETIEAREHYLDVVDLDRMRARLDEISGENFQRVVRQALERSGCEHVDFLAAVHMKRSMHRWLQEALGAERSLYLEEYGHMQAADQFVILGEARCQGLLRDGDVAVLAAAGVGYTWAATVVRWGASTDEATRLA
jgi:3-oxoacyl-[acyl-carrier-protein] synthase-3